MVRVYKDERRDRMTAIFADDRCRGAPSGIFSQLQVARSHRGRCRSRQRTGARWSPSSTPPATPKPSCGHTPVGDSVSKWQKSHSSPRVTAKKIAAKITSRLVSTPSSGRDRGGADPPLWAVSSPARHRRRRTVAKGPRKLGTSRSSRRMLLTGSRPCARGLETATEHLDKRNDFPRQIPRRRVQRVERRLL
jgi:hypothetical protein